MTFPRWITVVGVLAFGVAGCLAGDGTATQPPGDPCDPANDPGSSLSCDVQPTFTASCALSGCHAGTNPQQGMNLSEGQTFTNVVNVQSNQSPLLRIARSDPDASYLVHKVQGTHLTVGGCCAQMPAGGGAPLTPAQIDTIRSWVSAGALDN